MDERRKLKKHLTNFAALKTVYDSKFCTDEYDNPRSAFLLLRYVSSARTFLLCRKVKDIAAARSKLENQALPAHDIRHPLGHDTQHMAGTNLQNLLPPRAPTTVSVLAPAGGPRGRKRKNSSRGETSRVETEVKPKASQTKVHESGGSDPPQAADPVMEQVPIVPS